VICSNYQDDRVLPRHARALAERLGWSLGLAPNPDAEIQYLFSYFESKRLKPWPKLVAANFTHREEEPPNNAKAKAFDAIAAKVQLRTAWAQMYVDQLAPHGPTFKCSPALEREHFTLGERPLPLRQPQGRIVAGFSGYTYANHRKGEDLVNGIVASAIGGRLEWRASGRGWPVKTKMYAWADMPEFYRSLDVLVIPSRVEGIPMPPLEALCCGTSVVIPQGVGLLDELPEIAGIYRYERGDLATLLEALGSAIGERGQVEPEALRAATAQWSVEQWCEDHAAAFAQVFGAESRPMARPMAKAKKKASEEDTPRAVKAAPPAREYTPPPKREPKGTRGIYVVAYGEPARQAARELIATIRRHMPDVPIAVCAEEKLGVEDIHIRQPDRDVGARLNKLGMYDLSPSSWETVLYMDADLEVIAPIYPFFEWAEDGWDLVITKDPHSVDSMESYKRTNNAGDMNLTKVTLGTLDALQLAGGIMCFRRNERVKTFFDAWIAEWMQEKQRDQGPLVRALYKHPLKIWLLGNQWNTFLKYMEREQSAGVLHSPGEARRWVGMIPGPLDGPRAWEMVKRYEAKKPAGDKR
jgi:hypothetical protein